MLLLFNAVMNDSVVVFVGEPIRVSEDVRVIIDCSLLIDHAISRGYMNPTVKWYRDGILLSNRTVRNVIISQDRRRCIINATFFGGHGSQMVSYGDYNYTCEVNGNYTNHTKEEVCGE